MSRRASKDGLSTKRSPTRKERSPTRTEKSPTRTSSKEPPDNANPSKASSKDVPATVPDVNTKPSRASSKDAPATVPDASLTVEDTVIAPPPSEEVPEKEQLSLAPPAEDALVSAPARRTSKDAPVSDVPSRRTSKDVPPRRASKEAPVSTSSPPPSRSSSKDVDTGAFSGSFRTSLRTSLTRGNSLGFSGSYMPLNSDAFVEAEREFVMQRRKVGPFGSRTSSMEKFDNKVERVIEYTLGEHGWLSTCGSLGKIERNSSQVDADDNLERHYGFPDFDSSGYDVFESSGLRWPDVQFPLKLGLQLAVHTRTSIERMCFRRHKSTVAEGLTKDYIVTHLRSLKRLDHVNILRCQEIYEDDANLYLFYENFPCVTLLSFLRDTDWTQEQLVNLVRECSAAVAYALSNGFNHLGWTLAHILLPASCLKGDPMVAKIFGFGLSACFSSDETSDYSCWAPEAVEMLLRYGGTYASKLDIKMRNECDLWSLGALIYSMVARRPPFVAPPDSLSKAILQGQWNFNNTFDAVDLEAKGLVEELMHKVPQRRIKADMVLHNPWIRRRWRPPEHRHRVLKKLEEFCHAPLAKRLFGRFLVKFLDAEQLRDIAKSFYAMDHQGAGIIDEKSLKYTAKQLDRPSHAMHAMMQWAFPDHATTFSLQHYAESMAEDVIDGRALRHSFESLDADGSGEISAEELFGALHNFGKQLKLEHVLEHIAHADGGHQAEHEIDKIRERKLGFEEYALLFPQRVLRMKVLQDRSEATTHYADKIGELYQNMAPHVSIWIKNMESEADIVSKLAFECGEKRNADAVKSIATHIRRIADMLKHPPGPLDKEAYADLFDELTSRRGLKRHSKEKRRGPAEYFGFDSFMQDQAIHEFWPVLIDKERQAVKSSTHVDHVHGHVAHDFFKACDAGQRVVKKLDEVIEWAKYQLEEYGSFVEVLANPEVKLPGLVYSGRGLQSHGDDEDNQQEDDVAHDSSGDAFGSNFVDRLLKSCK